MLIRSMEIEDVEAIVDLEKELFTSPWNVDSFMYELTKNPFSVNLVLEDKEEIIGYIGFWLLGDQTQITTIGIRKERQGNGYANLLMDKCLAVTKEMKYSIITLEVRVSNISAISLYTKYGFKQKALRKKYYQDNHEDAYLMIKEWEV